MKTVVMIHTVAPLIEVFNRLAKDMLPGVQVFHVLDEPLLEQVRQQGDLASGSRTRLNNHFQAARDIGAEVVLVTCSTISPFLEEIISDLPVVKIDQAMMEQAVRLGSHIAVLATNPATLAPTRKALEKQAAAVGKNIEIQMVLVDEAFDKFRESEFQAHDQLIKDAISRLPGTVDLIVLAQASMGRVLDSLPESIRPAPILSSPYTALTQVRTYLQANRASQNNSHSTSL